MPQPQPGGCPVDDVIVAPAPAKSAGRPAAERDALLSLSQTLSHEPRAATQKLVDVAMRLTDADSAGISLEDEEGGNEIFRWVAVGGEFTRYLNGTMPRHFSPCGTVLERARTLVMRDPARHYEYISQIHVPVHSLLLVPFGRSGKWVGTVWVVSHQPGKEFTTEDVRTVETLTTFSTAVLDAAGKKH